MIGNQDKTEQLLKKTSEHGVILMSIKSLWQKIALKTDKQKEIYFIWHKSGQGQSSTPGEDTVFSQEDCLGQLDVIKAYIEGYQLFRAELDKPIAEIDQSKVGQKSKQTYLQRMKERLQTLAA